MTSLWDDPELRTGGEFVKFDNIGDAVAGQITAVRAHRWDDGSVSPQILLVTDDGEEKTVTAGQVRLKAALAEKRPEAGDHLTIRLTDIERRSGGKTLKHFSVDVAPGEHRVPGESAPVTPAAAVDPQAAAAALANLTPEQRAQLGL
jgi:hypothetical protein